MAQINEQIKPQDQSLQEAQVMEQQLQTQELQELPEEQLAMNMKGLTSWASRKIIGKATTKPKSKKLKDMLKEYGVEDQVIEPVRTTKKPVMQKTEEELSTQINRPVDGLTAPPKEKPLEVPRKISEEIEAQGLGKSKLTDFDTTDNWQMNFDTIESEDDIKSVIAHMAEKNKSQIDEARRGVVGDEQLKGLADDLGQTPEFIEGMLSRKEGDAMSPEHVLASRQVIEQSAVKLKSLADKVASGDASDKDKFNFSRQFQFHEEFMAQFMGMRAEFGRGLRAFGIPQTTDSIELDRMMEVMTQVDRKMDINSLANDISMLDTATGINMNVQAKTMSKMRLGFDSVYEVYINSILSGFKTHYINAAGSAMRIGADAIDTKIAAYMGHWDVPAEDVILKDEWKAGMIADLTGFAESFKVAGQVAKSGEPYQGVQKLDNMDMRSITSDMYGVNPDSLLGGSIDFIGSVLRSPTERLMGGTDAFFRKMSERSKIARLAYREANAISQRNGLNQEKSLALLNDLIQNPTETMRREATEYSMDVTFQTPLGEMGQKFQKLTNHKNAPGLRYIFPFVKTPANLMKQGFLERTPAGFLFEKYRKDIMDGGSKGQMARSKMATGTALATSVYMMASQGTITGSQPQDREVAQARKQAGWRPYSFVVENEIGETEYISYKRMEPFSYILGSMADMHENLNESQYMVLGEEDDEKIERLLTASTIAMAENTLDRTFMTGMQDIMNVWTDPGRYGTRYIKSRINAHIPFAGLRRDISRIEDETIRTSKTIWEYIEVNTPLLRTNLPPALNSLGQEIKYDAVMNPWPVVAETDNVILQEAKRLSDETRRSAIPKPSNKIGGIELNTQEYHDFVKLSRSELVAGGKNFEETLEHIMFTDAYENAIDDDKLEMLRNVANQFDSAARNKFMEEEQSVFEKVTTRKLHRAAKYKAKEEGLEDEEALRTLQDEFIGGE